MLIAVNAAMRKGGAAVERAQVAEQLIAGSCSRQVRRDPMMTCNGKF